MKSDSTLIASCRCIQRRHIAHIVTLYAVGFRVKTGQGFYGIIFSIDAKDPHVHEIVVSNMFREIESIEDDRE